MQRTLLQIHLDDYVKQCKIVKRIADAGSIIAFTSVVLAFSGYTLSGIALLVIAACGIPIQLWRKRIANKQWQACQVHLARLTLFEGCEDVTRLVKVYDDKVKDYAPIKTNKNNNSSGGDTSA